MKRRMELELALLQLILLDCCCEGVAIHYDDPEYVYAFKVLGLSEGEAVEKIEDRISELSEKIRRYPK